MRYKTTNQHKNYWKNRKIDWEEAYLKTADHPHRDLIIQALKTFRWRSIWEVGCASGPNLLKIVHNFKDIQIGGSDLNADAIELARKTFKGGIFEVSSAEDMLLSDKSCDVILTDVALIYIGPEKIKKVLKEFRRITRNRIVLVEFDSKSWWRRLILRLKTGYNAYDYQKLLEEAGYFDVMKYKIPDEFYPNCGWVHSEFVTLISAKP